jgi:hypothetical protein
VVRRIFSDILLVIGLKKVEKHCDTTSTKKPPKDTEPIFYNVMTAAQLHGVKRGSTEKGICAEYMSENEISKKN